MGKAKDILLRPIKSGEANAFVRRVHYSGKVVQNSQIHIGVYYNGKLEGVMQFGPSLDKRKLIGLVEGTDWNEFIELNRMAFTDVLPRNSESRALSIAFKLLRKHVPQLKWVVTFADATQCGDGTIYRAAGFVLTGVKKNNQIYVMPDGSVCHSTNFTALGPKGATKQRRNIIHRVSATKGINIVNTGAASMKQWIEAGAEILEGHQIRYVYFLDPTCRDRLTVPELPFSALDEAGARMYRGEKVNHADA